MTDLVIKNPDGSYATTDATNLKGHNWHKTIRASDGTIPEEDIKRYYDIAMKLDWQDGWYSSEEMKAEAKRISENRELRIELARYKQQEAPAQSFDNNQPSPSATGSEDDLLDKFIAGDRSPDVVAAAERLMG